MGTRINNDLLSIIKNRRSVRTFNGQKIAREETLSIIEAATWAPTGCNNQELRFLVLDTTKEMDGVINFKPFLKGVSVIILIFCDMSLPMSHKMYFEYKHEKNLPYIDTGLALANMILYAKSKGIESCIFNLSEYHFKLIGKQRKKNIGRKIDKIKQKLSLHKTMKDNFEFYLRNQLKIPEHLKITCGVGFGFTNKYPDIETEKHGNRKVMREELSYYTIQKK